MKTRTEQKSVTRLDEAIPQQDVKGSKAASSDPQAFQDNTTEFREDILPQYAAPTRMDGWLHSGLND